MDLPARLKEYAKTHVETISKEYNKQNDKWKAYLNLVAGAQTTARDHIQGVLDDIKRKEAEADAFALMALSLVGIAAASWIGAIIELKLYPRFAGKVHFKDQFRSGTYRVRSELEYSEIAAKFFGDSLHEITGHALDKVFERVMPKQEGLQRMDPGLGFDIQAGQLGSFKTRLENALLDASAVTTGQLAILSENINQHRDAHDGHGFGEGVVSEVEKRFLRAKGMRADAADRQQEMNGMRMLDEYFDKLREAYAKKWFYYGNNPVTSRLPFLSFHIELEMWALWILNQEWIVRQGGDDPTDVYDYYISEDGFHLDDIMDALRDLAGKEMMAVLHRSPRKSPLRNQPGWVEEIPPAQDKLDELAPTSKLYNVAKHGVAAIEMDNIIKWAKSNPGKILHGNVDYRPRRIGTISNVASVFAD